MQRRQGSCNDMKSATFVQDFENPTGSLNFRGTFYEQS
jgi:hypothetical protein